MFVECKACTDLEEGAYQKLSGLADKFGINATAVLIADAWVEHPDDPAPVDGTQAERGAAMGVVTIWKPEEIDDIGRTLLKLLHDGSVSVKAREPVIV